eukprot:1176020-Prorocentrum_minimum.AAC.3
MQADVTAYIHVYSRQMTESEILFAIAGSSSLRAICRPSRGPSPGLQLWTGSRSPQSPISRFRHCIARLRGAGEPLTSAPSLSGRRPRLACWPARQLPRGLDIKIDLRTLGTINEAAGGRSSQLPSAGPRALSTTPTGVPFSLIDVETLLVSGSR